jgi:hypothetical protein
MVTSSVKTDLPNPLILKGILHGTFTYINADYGSYDNGTGSLVGIGHVTYSGSTAGVAFDVGNFVTISSKKLGSLSLQFSNYNMFSRFMIISGTGSFTGDTGSGSLTSLYFAHSRKEVLKFD